MKITNYKKTNLKELHLARFLSASGIFLGAFYAFFKSILTRYMKDKYAEGISLGILSLYVIFTFPRFSILKMMLFLIARWINDHLLKKKYSYLTILSFIGLLCLCLNRYLARQDSFILGFAIPIISYLIRHIYPSEKIKSYLWRSLTIYLFFLPFEIMYYHKVVVLSFPLQIISTPLFILIGIVSLLCFFRIPIYAVDKGLVFLLKGYTGIIKPLSFGLLMPEFNIGLLIVYYAIYIIYIEVLND